MPLNNVGIPEIRGFPGPHKIYLQRTSLPQMLLESAKWYVRSQENLFALHPSSHSCFFTRAATSTLWLFNIAMDFFSHRNRWFTY